MIRQMMKQIQNRYMAKKPMTEGRMNHPTIITMNEMKPTMAEIAKMMSEIFFIAVLFLFSLQI